MPQAQQMHQNTPQKASKKLQTKLEKLLTSLQLDAAPAGGCVVVYHHGELVGEASIGQALPDQPWTSDTLSLNFSTGKGILVTLIHVLVSQGILKYDTSIAHYWPDFAKYGKERITLREVLTHQAGLFDITTITQHSEDMLDWQSMLNKVANMSPTEPRNIQAQSAYSALAFGWVLGGLIEQATQLSLNDALMTYLTKPLGIEDAVYFGVPDAQLEKVATLAKYFATVEGCPINTALSKAKVNRQKPTIKADSNKTLTTYQQLPCFGCWKKLVEQYANKKKKHHNNNNNNNNINNNNNNNNNEDGSYSVKKLTTAAINALYFDMRQLNFIDYKSALVPDLKSPLNYYSVQSLQACIPAANGVATAAALGAIYAMLANNGEWQGHQFIAANIMQELQKIYVTGSDAVMPAIDPNSMLWRLGYHRLFSLCHDVRSGFGHMGYNGSFGYSDPSRRLAIAFVHNFDVTMMTDIRQFAITEAVLQWVDDKDTNA